MSTPRVSILIPNPVYGRRGSGSGDLGPIDVLFRSLVDTLENDPTPVEIIVADDGSTDESLVTCRRWAQRSWRGGEPFCRLIELEHSGSLSEVANRLTSEARGELCCRLDDDIIILTQNWARELCGIFDQAPPGLGVVGPKQLSPDGRILSAGEWVFHPRGSHHVSQGAPRHAIGRAMEVDHVMGCFYCHRRAVWEQLGGYDESLTHDETVDFGLRARLQGWRTITTPTIEYVHDLAARRPCEAQADFRREVKQARLRFTAKWGFDRLAPDLDAVASRYAATPLLWNTRVFGPAATWPRLSTGPIGLSHSDWTRFTDDTTFRESIVWRAGVVEELAKQLGPRHHVAHVYSQSGLLCHLLAQRGIHCVGVDPDANQIALAETATAGQTYPSDPPTFRRFHEPRRIPLSDGSVDTVLLFDVVEHHANPVGLFKEAHRVLEPDGVLAVVTPLRDESLDADVDVLRAYRPQELLGQLLASHCFEPLASPHIVRNKAVTAIYARRRDVSDCTLQRKRSCDRPASHEAEPEVVTARSHEDVVATN